MTENFYLRIFTSHIQQGNIMKRYLTVIKTLFITSIIAASTGGCSTSDTARWTEEVKSWDGTVFQLEGRAERGADGFPIAHRGPMHYIEYYHRPTKAYWRSPGGYFPRIFDLVNGVPYVVIHINNESQCMILNYPEKSLLIYRWDSTKGWQSVNSNELPPNLEWNVMSLIFDSQDKTKDKRGFISLNNKVAEEGTRVGEFGTWNMQWGNNCAKQKLSGLKGETTQIAPNFLGFHGTPNF